MKTFNLTPGSSTETQVSTMTYDFADRPLRVTRPDGGWTQTDHWDSLMATAISTYVSSSGTGHKYEQFDGAGRMFKKGNDHPDGTANKYSGQVTVVDNVGQVSDTTNILAIDGNWNPTGEDLGNSFLLTHLTRDELSRLKLITYPDNNTRQVSYTGCGCAGNTEVRVTDELGQKTVSKTDFLGRLAEVTEPKDGDLSVPYSKAEYIYDTLDRLIEIRQSSQQLAGPPYTVPIQYRYFSYDGYGRLQSETTPEGGTVSYTYNDNDQVLTVTNQRNITVTNSYNSRNLLTGVSYSDGAPSVSFGYDDFGARTSMTDGEGATSYTYNSYRQLQSETRTFTALAGNSYVLNYAYNLTGQPTQVNYSVYGMPGGIPVSLFTKNINYAYNNVSALSGIGTNLIGTNPNATTNVLSPASFRASGTINVLTYGNGRRLTMGYSQERSQPVSMVVDKVSDPSDKIIDYSYDYYKTDPGTGESVNNNRIRKITDRVDGSYTTTYVYDYYNRLTQALSSANNSYFDYDHFGNITNYQGMTINYATNTSGAPATNRISTAVVGSTTYTHSYDAAGNLTNDGQQAYTYDGANRLKEVGTGGQNTYGYDGDGARVRKTESGSALFYVRSTVLGNVAMEVNQSQGVVRAYVYSNGQLIAQQASDGNFYWVHQNHLGSGHKLTDSTGAMKFQSEYTAYGQLLLDWSASGAPNTRKFTGYERDAATGLDYANARMYGSSYGRFTTPDPAGLGASKTENPQSLNRYSYVNNDPVNRVDLTGNGDIPFTDYVLRIQTIVWLSNGGFGGGGAYTPLGANPNADAPRKGPRWWENDDTQASTDVHRRKEREGFDEAGKKLKGACNDFYESMIQEAANSATYVYPNGSLGSRPPLQGASTYVLNQYWAAMDSGNVTNSGKSGAQALPDGSTYVVYGVTTNFTSVEWNNEFYGLSASERGLHTLHEALHQIPGFTDEVIANAARIVTNRSPIGNQTPSEYFNGILRSKCQ